MVQEQSGKRRNAHTQQTSEPPYLGSGFRSGKAVAGIVWVPLLCIRRANHLVHESTWLEFSQLATATNFCGLLVSALCSLFVLICLHQRLFFHFFFWELNSSRDLPWNSHFQAGFIHMKNLIQDQHMVQSLSLSSISDFLQLDALLLNWGPLPKLFCLFLSISIDFTYHCCLLSNSLPSSLSRCNIWNFHRLNSFP